MAINTCTYIIGLFVCLCDDKGKYDFTTCSTGLHKVQLNRAVIPGRLFNVSLAAVDIVGSIGHSDRLYSDAFQGNTASESHKLTLGDGQHERPFSVTSRTCISVEFIVYSSGNSFSDKGIMLRLTTNRQQFLHVLFEISRCPVGFKEQKIDSSSYGCVCDKFFEQIDNRFRCVAATGYINRLHHQAWLSTNNGGLEYAKICSPTYCHSD